MRLIKRSISMLLTLALVISMCVVSNAAEMPTAEMSYKDFAEYRLDFSQVFAQRSSAQDVRSDYEKLSVLLSNATPLRTVRVHDTVVNTFENSLMFNLIPGSESINAVESINGDFYIDYNSIDGKRVILEYHKDGSIGKSIYNKEKDELIVVGSGLKGALVYKDATKAIVEEISPDKLEEIESALSSDDPDIIKAIKDIEVQNINGKH